MPPVGIEPTFSAGEQTQTHALDRAATGTDNDSLVTVTKSKFKKKICGTSNSLFVILQGYYIKNIAFI